MSELPDHEIPDMKSDVFSKCMQLYRWFDISDSLCIVLLNKQSFRIDHQVTVESRKSCHLIWKNMKMNKNEIYGFLNNWAKNGVLVKDPETHRWSLKDSEGNMMDLDGNRIFLFHEEGSFDNPKDPLHIIGIEREEPKIRKAFFDGIEGLSELKE